MGCTILMEKFKFLSVFIPFPRKMGGITVGNHSVRINKKCTIFIGSLTARLVPSQQIEVIDIKNNITSRYDSISSAALALDIKNSRISNFLRLNQKSPYKDRYIFKKV